MMDRSEATHPQFLLHPAFGNDEAACTGLGDQLLCWTCGPCTDCAYQALLVLRNLAFCTENHAHFLAAPRMLPAIASLLSATVSHLPLAAAASCLWTLTYHSEKVTPDPQLVLHAPAGYPMPQPVLSIHFA